MNPGPNDDNAVDRPIGVFDSGVGGLSVLNALRHLLPLERFVYFADTAHAPYGERGDAHVIERTRDVARHLLQAHQCKALVVACNTATAAAVHLLRAKHHALPVVGVEPALKPAVAASRSRRIGVLATRGTLRSGKFQALHASLANQAEFVLQPCDGLAAAIEANDSATIAALCRDYMGAMGASGASGASGSSSSFSSVGSAPGEIDCVVLGCTHYPFVAGILQAHAAPSVRFFETGGPVARQTHHLLSTRGQLRSSGPGEVTLLTSGAVAALDAAAARWLQYPAGPARRADVPLHATA